MKRLSEADFNSWRFNRDVMHFNGGAAFFGWGHRCVDQPRLLVIDKYFRKDRSTKRSYLIDDKLAFDALDDALAALSAPPSLSAEERATLASMPADWFYPEKRVPYSRLVAMGLAEWRKRDDVGIACRITESGRLALAEGERRE